MSVDTSAINDPEEWESLSHEEQSEILQEGYDKAENTNGTGGDDRDIPDWEEVDEVSQEQTLAALQGALEETWTAKVFEQDDDQRTIPFEICQMTEEQQDSVTEWMEVFAELEESGVDSLDEIDDLDQAGDILDTLDEFDPWLNQFLADLSVGETFTVDWWSDGTKLPAGTKLQLFFKIFGRHQEQSKNTQSFR